MSSQTLTPKLDVPEEKWADAAPSVHEVIRARWSPRSFSSREVSDEDLKTLLDAARWAASSYNEQPWRFLIARKTDPGYDKVLNLLVPFNQAWAKTAPVLIITAAKRTFSHNTDQNFHAWHDVGAALANLFLQATALGLHAHGMAGFDRERAQKELGFPDDFAAVAAVALGYRDSPDKLPAELTQNELGRRQRKPIGEIAFGASWNQPLKLG